MSRAARISLDVAGLHRLPAIPQVLTKLLEALQDDGADVSKLSRLIEMDAALSAKLLAAANSPAYRRNTQINSIRDGIMTMGWDMVKTLALSAAMYQVMHEFSGRKRHDLCHFWRHSLSTALLGKQLATKLHDLSPDKAYLAGLLHDIGRLALLVTFPQRYGALYEQSEDDPSLLLAETREFGADHCEIGAWLIQDWEISSFLQDAIAFHHDPAANLRNATSIVKTTHFANTLSMEQQRFSPACLLEAQEWFGLEARDLYQLVSRNDEQVKAMAMSLGIDIGTQAENQEKFGHPEPADGSRHPGQPESNPDKALTEAMARTALLDHVTKIMSGHSDLAEFHMTLQQVAWLLYGARQVLIFELKAEQGRLSGRAMTPQQEWVEAISFPLDQESGLIASALAWGCHTHSFGQADHGKIDTAERQLIRVCATDGILCVPMLVADTQYGVMVLAMDAEEAQSQLDDTALAQFLASIAASHLQSQCNTAATPCAGSEKDPSQDQLQKFVHEASNPLSTIKNYLGILHRKLVGKGVESEELRIVDEEIDRVSLLISHLTDAPAAALHQPTSIDINQAVKDVILMHQETHLRPSGISVRLHLDDKLPRISSLPHKLRQILTNLLRNAAEAMPNGGELSISTCSESVPGGAGGLVIQVTDTGPGIDDEIREKLFSPVQSTKGTGHSGIGLSIVAETVCALGGDIRCRSVIGSGSTFEIRLPYHLEVTVPNGNHSASVQMSEPRELL